MDVQDASQDPECLPFLRAEEQAILNAQFVKGRRPDKKLSRAQAAAIMAKISSEESPTKKGVRCFYVYPGYPPCMVPLSDLTKVMIDDLTLETHHRGSYIVLRTITPGETRLDPVVAVEDEDQRGVLLQLPNMAAELSAEPHLLDKGTVLLVKEPYLRSIADRAYSIRVDHRSNLVFLSEYDSEFPFTWLLEMDASESDWKVRGDDMLSKQVYHIAIECYSQALKYSPNDEETLAIRAEQAIAFLKDQQFDAVVNGTLDINLNGRDLHVLGDLLLYRAHALYKLRKWQASHELFTQLANLFPGDNVIRTAVFQSSARMTEARTGRYPFRQMQQEASTLHSPRLNHATHFGSVAMRPTACHGIGVFTTKPVQAGDLLLCVKAFSYAYPADDPDKNISILINAQANAITKGTPASLVDITLHFLHKNPSLISMINGLDHGSYESVGVSEVDGRPGVDPFLVQNVVWLNCFGCPISTRDIHLQNRRITEDSNLTEQFTSTGIWPMASFINHSCFANSRRSFIGDMMIVRATRDLAPNTEVTFWYQSPCNTPVENKAMDLPRWGFQCSCSICQDYENTDPLTIDLRRRLLHDASMMHMPSTDAEILKIDFMLCRIENTYKQPASEVPRLHLYSYYLTLAQVYERRHEPIKYVEWVLKALKALGYIIEGGKLSSFNCSSVIVKKWGLMLDVLVKCWMGLARAYHVGAPRLEVQAKEYARITYRACVGEDETFEATYWQFPQEHF